LGTLLGRVVVSEDETEPWFVFVVVVCGLFTTIKVEHLALDDVLAV
jgi:hypothetical protein